MASKRRLERRIERIRKQVEEQVIHPDSYFPDPSLLGRVEAIEKYLGIEIRAKGERVSPVEVIVIKIPKPVKSKSAPKRDARVAIDAAKAKAKK